MSGWQVLRRVEWPLALPLVMTGVRLAAVQVVATATIAALVAGPGLGRIIASGYGRQDQAELVAGAILVALLALLVEVAWPWLSGDCASGRTRRSAVHPAAVGRAIRDRIVTRLGMPLAEAWVGSNSGRSSARRTRVPQRHGTHEAVSVMNARPRLSRRVALALGSMLTLALTACGGGDGDAFDEASPSASGAAGAASGALTVGGANFTEMLIMEQLYGQLLAKAGFTVDYKAVDNREIYAKSLGTGEIDVVPEYAATMAEFLNIAKNGDGAKTVATSDVADTMAALKPLRRRRA